jgi:protein TonB
MAAPAITSKGCGLTGTLAAHGVLLTVCLLLAEGATLTPLPLPAEAVRISLAEPAVVSAAQAEMPANPEPALPREPEPPAPPLAEKQLPITKKVGKKPDQRKQPPCPKERTEPAGAPAARPAPASDSAVKEARQTLLSALIARIEKEKRYPASARRLGLEGQVTAVVRVDSQGRIVSVGVQEVRGHAILEKTTIETLNRVRSAWKPVPVPEAMTLHIPVLYTLKVF